MKKFVFGSIVAVSNAEYSVTLPDDTATIACSSDPWGHTECAYNECCGFSYQITDEEILDETAKGYEAAFSPAAETNDATSPNDADGIEVATYPTICMPTMTEKINDGEFLYGFSCYMEISAHYLTLAGGCLVGVASLYA